VCSRPWQPPRLSPVRVEQRPSCWRTTTSTAPWRQPQPRRHLLPASHRRRLLVLGRHERPRLPLPARGPSRALMADLPHRKALATRPRSRPRPRLARHRPAAGAAVMGAPPPARLRPRRPLRQPRPPRQPSLPRPLLPPPRPSHRRRGTYMGLTQQYHPLQLPEQTIQTLRLLQSPS